MLLLASAGAIAQKSVEYNYSDGKDYNLREWGTGKKETYNIAIKIDNPCLKGLRVTALQIPLVKGVTNVSDYTAFLTRKLEVAEGKAVADIANVHFTPDEAKVTVELPEPYTIGDEPFYAGYRLTVDNLNSTNKHPVAVTAGIHDSGLMVATSRTYRSWKNMSENLQRISPLTIVLEGDIKDHAAIPLSMDNIRLEKNKEGATRAIIANTGLQPVEKIDYCIEADGQTLEFQSVLPHPIPAKPYGETTSIEIKIPPIGEQGSYTGKLSILRVNGQPNPMADKTVGNTLRVIPFVPVHRAVMEEFTGTWCGWCPRGWVAMEEMKKRHPDQFIALSYHYDDIMQVTNTLPVSVSSFPSACIDRGSVVDPYFGNTSNENLAIEKLWQDRCNQPAPAGIQIKASLNKEQTEVVIHAEVVFAEDLNTHPYRLSYYITADGLKGEGNLWAQANNYSGNQNAGEDFRYFIDGGPQMQIEFNDVVIARTSFDGLEESLPEAIHPDELLTHEYRFLLADMTSQYHSGTPLVQDINRLNAVVLLVNTETGKVENAAKCPVMNNGSSLETSEKETKVTEMARYDMEGRKTDKSHKGPCLILMSDGTVKKVYIY